MFSTFTFSLFECTVLILLGIRCFDVSCRASKVLLPGGMSPTGDPARFSAFQDASIGEMVLDSLSNTSPLPKTSCLAYLQTSHRARTLCTLKTLKTSVFRGEDISPGRCLSPSGWSLIDLVDQLFNFCFTASTSTNATEGLKINRWCPNNICSTSSSEVSCCSESAQLCHHWVNDG